MNSGPVCLSYIQEVLSTTSFENFGRNPFVFGQYTDDSQLARELLQSFLVRGKFDPADYATRIAAIFNENRIVGMGMATLQAAKRLIAGISWEKSGTPAPAAGNGSAMRAGPIGLMFWNNPEHLVQAASDQGQITHADPRCHAGAIIIAGSVSYVLQNENIEPTVMLHHLEQLVKTVSPDMYKGLQQLHDILD